MNKINWINEEIEYCRCKINKAKQEKLYQKTLAVLNPKSKNIDSETLTDFHILLNEKKIQTLQQIKTELEAWEIVKQNFVLQWEDKDNSSGYYFKYFGDKEYEILKKALGVKDE